MAGDRLTLLAACETSHDMHVNIKEAIAKRAVQKYSISRLFVCYSIFLSDILTFLRLSCCVSFVTFDRLIL